MCRSKSRKDSPNPAASKAMEFRFRAGDGGPRRPSSRLFRPCDRRFTPRAGPGPLHGGPPPPLIEWEAAARRERIIREEVERRLIEEEVCRELALARARLHGGFGPEPFFRPDGPFVPPSPGPLLGVDVPFMPPTRSPPMPAGMHPNGPSPASFGPRPGSGPRWRLGIDQRKLRGEARRRPLPAPKPKHNLESLKVEPSESSEVLSSEAKISSVKSKADASAVPAEPTPSSEANISGVKRKPDVISATTEPTKLQKAARDWSCALCQVRATSEATLNTHLEGKKHKAKLARCGAIKVISGDERCFQAAMGNKDGACPSDTSRKICILVDEVMHEVVQKSNYLWCERCRVRCENNVTMADHLRGKKHSELNKIWKSIKAMRLNKKSEEDSAATCMRKVNENGPIKIPDEEKKEGASMASESSENGPVRFYAEMKKETTDMTEEVNENSLTEAPVDFKKEDTGNLSEVHKNGHNKIPTEAEHEDTDMASQENEKNGHAGLVMDFKQEGTDMVMDANRNDVTEIPAKDIKEGADVAMERNAKNCFSEIPIETTYVAADVTRFVPKEE